MGDEETAACSRDGGRKQWRKERWRRVRLLRLKGLCFSVAWPILVVFVFVMSEVGVYFLAQLVPGLDRHDKSLYGFIVPLVMWVLFMMAGVYWVFSPRNEARVRRWGRRGPWAIFIQPMDKSKRHARYCAARNRGTAAVFLAVCALEAFFSWRDLYKPLPPDTQPIFDAVGIAFCIVFLMSLLRSFTCFRERLVLSVGAAILLLQLALIIAPSFAKAFGSAARNFSLLLWTLAALASLALLKSALGAPTP